MSCVMGDHVAEDDAGEINTTLLELQDALATALRNAGVMGKLRAQLRAAAVGIIRGDPHLREAAVGQTSLPSAMSLEARVALLLIQDFARVHGLRHTLGVFEAESNMCLVGESERETARVFFQPHSGACDRPSALERLVAGALSQAAQETLQNRQNGEEIKGEEKQSTIASLAERTAPDSAFVESTCHMGKKQEDEEMEMLDSIVAVGLKECESSVTYSTTSVTDISCSDDPMYDFIEKF